jgi:hypothetical protein
VVLSLPPSSSDLPVMRFCKTDSNSDILIPNFHFHTKHYDTALLASDVTDKFPCA